MAKILVIEDQKQLGQLYASVLSRNKHQIILAYTGEDGVAQALRETPDLIILDMMLPGISGTDVARQLWEQGVLARSALIVATAVPDQARPISQFCKVGAVLVKPFQVKSLVAAVRQTLSQEETSNQDPAARPALARQS